MSCSAHYLIHHSRHLHRAHQIPLPYCALSSELLLSLRFLADLLKNTLSQVMSSTLRLKWVTSEVTPIVFIIEKGQSRIYLWWPRYYFRTSLLFQRCTRPSLCIQLRKQNKPWSGLRRSSEQGIHSRSSDFLVRRRLPRTCRPNWSWVFISLHLHELHLPFFDVDCLESDLSHNEDTMRGKDMHRFMFFGFLHCTAPWTEKITQVSLLCKSVASGPIGSNHLYFLLSSVISRPWSLFSLRTPIDPSTFPASGLTGVASDLYLNFPVQENPAVWTVLPRTPTHAHNSFGVLVPTLLGLMLDLWRFINQDVSMPRFVHFAHCSQGFEDICILIMLFLVLPDALHLLMRPSPVIVTASSINCIPNILFHCQLAVERELADSYIWAWQNLMVHSPW